MRRTNTRRRSSVRSGNTYPSQKGLHRTAYQKEEYHDATVGSCLPGASGSPPLYSWVTRTTGPAKLTQKERRAERKAGETAQESVTPAAKSGPLRALRVIERNIWRNGVLTVKSHPPANKGGNKPTPSVEAVPQRPTPRQLGTRHPSAAAAPRGSGPKARTLAAAPP